MITKARILQIELGGVAHMHKYLQHQRFLFPSQAKFKKAWLKLHEDTSIISSYFIRTSLSIPSIRCGITCLAWSLMHKLDGGVGMGDSLCILFTAKFQNNSGCCLRNQIGNFPNLKVSNKPKCKWRFKNNNKILPTVRTLLRIQKYRSLSLTFPWPEK